MTVSNNWVNALRADEADRRAELELWISQAKSDIRIWQKERKALNNMAINRHKRHLKKGVDMDVSKP